MIRSALWTRSQPRRSRARGRRACRRGRGRGSRPSRSAGSSSARYSSIVYSRRCQGLSDFSAPSGASVSRFGVEMKASGAAAAIAASSSSTVLDVLDRLQEDDGVETGAAGDVLDQVALEAQVRAHVAAVGVLVRLGVGVDADDRRRRCRRARPSRSPPRRRGRRRSCPPPARRSTRRRRGGAGTSSSPRGRRAASAPRSAPAAGPPRAGPACTYRLPMGGAGRYSPAPCLRLPTPRPSASATSTRATTTSPPPSYDAKWGIDFGETGREQVGAKLRKALGEEPGPWERRARDRRRHRLLLTQPDGRGDDRAS